MDEVDCPYCSHTNEIMDPSYDEDWATEMTCKRCAKHFEYLVEVQFTFNAYCLDKEHNLSPYKPHDSVSWESRHCSRCDYSESRRIEEKVS